MSRQILAATLTRSGLDGLIKVLQEFKKGGNGGSGGGYGGTGEEGNRHVDIVEKAAEAAAVAAAAAAATEAAAAAAEADAAVAASAYAASSSMVMDVDHSSSSPQPPSTTSKLPSAKRTASEMLSSSTPLTDMDLTSSFMNLQQDPTNTYDYDGDYDYSDSEEAIGREYDAQDEAEIDMALKQAIKVPGALIAASTAETTTTTTETEAETQSQTGRLLPLRGRPPSKQTGLTSGGQQAVREDTVVEGGSPLPMPIVSDSVVSDEGVSSLYSTQELSSLSSTLPPILSTPSNSISTHQIFRYTTRPMTPAETLLSLAPHPQKVPDPDAILDLAKNTTTGLFDCPHPGCGISQSRRYNLKVHYMTHLGSDWRLFACEDCGRAFRRRFDLVRHRNALHGVPLPTSMPSAGRRASGSEDGRMKEGMMGEKFAAVRETTASSTSDPSTAMALVQGSSGGSDESTTSLSSVYDTYNIGSAYDAGSIEFMMDSASAFANNNSSSSSGVGVGGGEAAFGDQESHGQDDGAGGANSGMSMTGF